MSLRNGATVTFAEDYLPSTYTVLGVLGAGAFGSVYLVGDESVQSSRDLYALKIISHVELPGSLVEQQILIFDFKTKWRTLRQLNHPNRTILQ